jgi:hypothetical protein
MDQIEPKVLLGMDAEAQGAYLRQAFYECTEQWFNVFRGREGVLSAGWKPMSFKEESAIMDAWSFLYKACRDTEIGLAMLKELGDRQNRIDALEREVARLNGKIIADPDYRLSRPEVVNQLGK